MTKAVRQRDQLLRRSFRGHLSTAAFLVNAGLLGVWLQLDVSGFCSVLARGWHGDSSRCEMSARIGAADGIYKNAVMSETTDSDLVTQLVKLVVDLTWFLDSSSPDEVDPDWAVKWQEHIGHAFAGLPPGQRRLVTSVIQELRASASSPAPAEWLDRFQEVILLAATD
jgi:hypothetical protein